MTFGKADCTQSFSVSLENFQAFIAEFMISFLFLECMISANGNFEKISILYL